MQDVAQKLAGLEEKYLRYLEKVNEFFATAAGTFTAQYFPSIRIERRSSDPQAPIVGDLFVLGAHSEIRFDFTMFGHPVAGMQVAAGILEVARPATAHEDRNTLGVWYFDLAGNIRHEPTGPNSFQTIGEKSFVIEVIDTVEQASFACIRSHSGW